MAVETIHRTLLNWYDAEARLLPWRVPPGSDSQPDPYRIWLSEIMLQQTTVAAVTPYYHRFIQRWPTVFALASADEDELMRAWAGLGYYARARNLLACAREVVAKHDGRFPSHEPALKALPGIGDYTAAAIAAIAFDRPATVVDGNVERVVARLFAVETPLPQAKPELRRLAAVLTPRDRAGDYAQAMMDLGATICTPRAPSCPVCPLRGECRAFASGDPSRLPRRAHKQSKPVREGIAWWLEAEDHVLLTRRPPKGLLGGMMALPSSGWDGRVDTQTEPPSEAQWHLIEDPVIHIFSHFALTLRVAYGRQPARKSVDGATWWPIAAIEHAGLPSLFTKAARLALGSKNERR